MARTSVTTQSITRAGLNTAMTAPPVDGDIIDAGAVFLEVLNGSGSPITVTVQTAGTVEGLPVEDLAVTVPAAGNRRIGPFPGVFKQAADAVVGAGRVLVDYSAVTSVTRAVVKIGA
jgi:hypothetical protein